MVCDGCGKGRVSVLRIQTGDQHGRIRRTDPRRYASGGAARGAGTERRRAVH